MALLAKFQPGVLNPFVLICRCLPYQMIRETDIKIVDVKVTRYTGLKLLGLSIDSEFLMNMRHHLNVVCKKSYRH